MLATEIVYGNEYVKSTLNFHWEEAMSWLDFFKIALLTFQHVPGLQDAEGF